MKRSKFAEHLAELGPEIRDILQPTGAQKVIVLALREPEDGMGLLTIKCTGQKDIILFLETALRLVKGESVQ